MKTTPESSLPRRKLSGRFWHQGSTRHPLGSFADPALTDGRYHRLGGAGVWYASDREQTAWAELFRHFTSSGVDPFEVRRRVGAAEVHGLEVLDLCDASVRSALGVGYDDLVGDDYVKSQEVAERARAEGYEGLLAPSAAVHGGRHWSSSPSACTGLCSRSRGSASHRRAWLTSSAL